MPVSPIGNAMRSAEPSTHGRRNAAAGASPKARAQLEVRAP
jgi:hypothetical protein